MKSDVAASSHHSGLTLSDKAESKEFLNDDGREASIQGNSGSFLFV